jgi:malic enzyme
MQHKDLSLYISGVAEPCLEIAKDVNNVYKYTAKEFSGYYQWNSSFRTWR